MQNGMNVEAGNGSGRGISQLWNPRDLYVEDDQTVCVGDPDNHHIVEWKYRATSGNVAAGGKIQENGFHLLQYPTHVIMDNERDNFIIGDSEGTLVAGGHRQEDRPNHVFVDVDHYVYLSDSNNDPVMKWEEGAKEAINVHKTMFS